MANDHASVQTWYRQCGDLTPLCSFGPGGSYQVDWQVRPEDYIAYRHIAPARTVAVGLGRFLGQVIKDAALWIAAVHPARRHRLDTWPESLDSCPQCGHQDLWQPWVMQKLRSGQVTPQWISQPEAVTSLPAEKPALLSASPVVVTPVEIKAPRKRTKVMPRKPHTLKLVGTVSGPSATISGLFNIPNTAADLLRSQPSRENLSHERNPQANSHSRSHTGLSTAERVLPDHAGNRRSAGHIESNRVRTHRSPRTKGAAGKGSLQGSLFAA